MSAVADRYVVCPRARIARQAPPTREEVLARFEGDTWGHREGTFGDHLREIIEWEQVRGDPPYFAPVLDVIEADDHDGMVMPMFSAFLLARSIAELIAKITRMQASSDGSG